MEQVNNISPVIAVVAELHRVGKDLASLVPPHLASDPMEYVKAISIAQKGDQFCKPIIDYLKGQNKKGMAADAETIYYSRHMGLDNHGILWHMQDYQGNARRRGMRIQLVVPETLRRSLLKWCHEGHFAAHVGRDRALEVLREGYFWKNMFGDLTNYIQHCQACQVTKDPPGRLRYKVSNLQRPSPSQPFQVLHLDSCTVRGAVLMLFVCAFSGYIVVEHMVRGVNGKNLSESFIDAVVCKFGTPLVLICDNVSYNVGGLFPQTLKMVGTKLTPATRYHPQANGKVERRVAVMKGLLKALANSNQGDWKKMIQIAAFAYNSTFCPSIGHSPWFLVHGVEPVLPGPVNTALATLRAQTEREDVSQFAEDLEQRILRAFRVTHNKLRRLQQAHTHPSLLTSELKEGDRVLLYDPQPSTDQLRIRWRGPHIIKEVVSPAVFRIADEQKLAKTELAHISRLKKYVPPTI